jgi:hypothetical protein
MALIQGTLTRRAASFVDVVRIIAIVAAAIVVMLALTVVFGFNGAGPSFDLTADPGAGLGLPY